MLNYCSYPAGDIVQLKRKMLSWANRFNIFCFLDRQQYSHTGSTFECLLGAGAQLSVEGRDPSVLASFTEREGWKMGHISYEANHQLFGINDEKPDPIGFPNVFFFIPQHLLRIEEDRLVIESEDPELIYQEVMKQDIPGGDDVKISFEQRLSREEYLHKIEALRQHIQRGDCYEINFCQEFFAEDVEMNPVHVFNQLMEASPNPFAACYRVNECYLLCASPERYLLRKENILLSQPIKGTIKRDREDPLKDQTLADQLWQSAKDRSENVMVVDLVRNDLTLVAEDRSVEVSELYGIYSFPQVHQMISTVQCRLKEGIRFVDIISASFPMGSMTGAPKKRVMELIEQYEEQRRGIFSGTVGYIDPSGNFDLNVVIRSLMYQQERGYLSYQVGSGITFYSQPESEWDECLLKAEGIKKVLT